MFGVLSRQVTEEDLNLENLRQEVFDFGCGGRMAGLWGSWAALTRADRDHLCSRADVREHCVAWPQANAARFREVCVLVANLANGPVKAVWKRWDMHSKVEEQEKSVLLSGHVDLDGLPPKGSERCRMLQRRCT